MDRTIVGWLLIGLVAVVLLALYRLVLSRRVRWRSLVHLRLRARWQ